MTDTPTMQPDLSDEGLRKLAEAMFDMDMDESAQALLEVRDQARAAALRSVKDVLEMASTPEGLEELRKMRAAEKGGKDASTGPLYTKRTQWDE
jgi:hypothetical protein